MAGTRVERVQVLHPRPVRRHLAGPDDFAAALTGGGVQVVDLTAPLSAQTPVIQLPPEFAQTARFELHELSRYDDRGPAWYWNDIHTGEHTGTHFDAPNHWVTGRYGEDVASVPADRLIAPAVVALSPLSTTPSAWRYAIALVALAIVIAAVVVSTRRQVGIAADSPSDPPVPPPSVTGGETGQPTSHTVQPNIKPDEARQPNRTV